MRISDWSSDVCSSDLKSTDRRIAFRGFGLDQLENLGSPQNGYLWPERLALDYDVGFAQGDGAAAGGSLKRNADVGSGLSIRRPILTRSAQTSLVKGADTAVSDQFLGIRYSRLATATLDVNYRDRTHVTEDKRVDVRVQFGGC